MLQVIVSENSVCYSSLCVIRAQVEPGACSSLFQVKNSISCGNNVESLAFEVLLAGSPLKLHNVFNELVHRVLDISEVCVTAVQDCIIIVMDFNAHLPLLSPEARAGAA